MPSLSDIKPEVSSEQYKALEALEARLIAIEKAAASGKSNAGKAASSSSAAISSPNKAAELAPPKVENVSPKSPNKKKKDGCVAM